MTTMKLGATRQMPFAPDTCQLGKYDDFTRIGVPTRSTSNDTVDVPSFTFDTFTSSTAIALGCSSFVIRGHALGPLTARSTPHFVGSRYHASAMSCHARPPLATSVTTAGSAFTGSTRGASAT